MIRILARMMVVVLALGAPAMILGVSAAVLGVSSARAAEDFSTFLAGLWPQAKARGVTRATFDAALDGLTPDAGIVALTRKQSEFSKPIWGYLDDAASPARLAAGRTALAETNDFLRAVERQTGVDKRVVLGIWGMETHFGAAKGNKDVLRSLATLAHARYRDDFFREELLVALTLIEQGVVAREAMRGSWAGAMGHTQFMPSSYAHYAVDGDGDGARDLMGSAADALASSAHYLKAKGWQAGVPWGVEVRLPAGFDLKQGLDEKPFARWASAGFVRADGRALPPKGTAQLYFPAGRHGPALLITENYRVIKSYNSSDAYALGVAHLGDRLAGAGAFHTPWPRQAKRLSSEEVKTLQSRLIALGLLQGKIDGRIGEQSRNAIKQAQLRFNFPPDGYPDAALLARIKTP